MVAARSVTSQGRVAWLVRLAPIQTWSCILHAAGKILRRDRASSNRCHGTGISQTHPSAPAAQREIQGQGKALRESLMEGYRDALLVDHARPVF